jgi:hypothetical protein
LFPYSGWSFASQIQILFKSAEFYPLIFQQQLTALDFISYCGGSLGLFLGFSALSAIELVYYFTMRLFFKRQRSNKVAILISDEEKKAESYLVKFMKSSSIHGCNRHRIEQFDDNLNSNFIALIIHLQLVLDLDCHHCSLLLFDNDSKNLQKL